MSVTRKALQKIILLAIIHFLMTPCVYGARIKDLADIKGVRQNQLVGYGLVVGLDGTGDGKGVKFTIQSMSSMLEKMGITLKPNDIAVKNVAAVMVSADLPPFSRAGNRIDVLVSSIGDCSSLQGGTLLLTPLRGVDGKVYAVAQGPVSIGGFSAGGAGGKVQKNFPTVGRVASGALVENEIMTDFNRKKTLSLCLHRPDFTTASRVAESINVALFDRAAETVDAGTIEVHVPDRHQGNLVELITLIENINIQPDMVSKVIINERTGTVVIGENVRISTIAISHGNLTIEIKEKPMVSQPLPFSEGETVVTPDTQAFAKEETRALYLMNRGVSIGEVVRGLNALGVSPRDLITIFQAIKAAGALHAKLEII
ncbi:MAG: flagellar basal body P-ring protein FlgI [Desulfatiglans sp.]|nr:flagellar basal body P-ring protein FlgI [Thermodesulfobacteriota bacterium]MEE4354445.1 flagellar basal body P-ring protein FlgI [Desulfatiglans sp.]